MQRNPKKSATAQSSPWSATAATAAAAAASPSPSSSSLNGLMCEAKRLVNILRTDYDLPPVPPVRNASIEQTEAIWKNTVQDLQRLVCARRKKAEELIREQYELCGELRVRPKWFTSDPLPLPNEIEQFGCLVEALRIEKSRRCQIVYNLRKSIKQYLRDLNLKQPSDATECVLLNNDHPQLGIESLNKLNEMLARYRQPAEQIKKEIIQMRHQLEEICSRVSTPTTLPIDWQSLRGADLLTYNRLRNELMKCERDEMFELRLNVKHSREELMHWWNKAFIDKATRHKFIATLGTNCTEQMLTTLKKEVQSVMKYYETNRQLFHLYVKHKHLMFSRKRIEKRAFSPTLASNQLGRLMRNDLRRYAINKHIPAIERSIEYLATLYQCQLQDPILIQGRDILNIITDGQLKMYREEAYRIRKRARYSKKLLLNAKQQPSLQVLQSKMGLPRKIHNRCYGGVTWRLQHLSPTRK